MNSRTKCLRSALCVLVLLAGLSSTAAFAAEADVEEAPLVLPCFEVPLYADGAYIGSGIMMNDTTFVPLRTFVETMLQESFEVTWDQETNAAVLTAEDLRIALTMDDGYMTVNDRYVYLENRVFNINGTIVVPIRELARLFALAVAWDPTDCSVCIDTSTLELPEDGDSFYPQEDLYWLSRVIYSESGNQPLAGMIGVGNVVLNRADDDSGLFGDGIHGVIFLPGQFDVVPAGTIYLNPSEKAIAAAKLCLEGYNTVGDAKWFVNPAIGATSWFRTYKTFALTIADHDFYA